jgi:hypothetical protein
MPPPSCRRVLGNVRLQGRAVAYGGTFSIDPYAYCQALRRRLAEAKGHGHLRAEPRRGGCAPAAPSRRRGTGAAAGRARQVRGLARIASSRSSGRSLPARDLSRCHDLPRDLRRPLSPEGALAQGVFPSGPTLTGDSASSIYSYFRRRGGQTALLLGGGDLLHTYAHAPPRSLARFFILFLERGGGGGQRGPGAAARRVRGDGAAARGGGAGAARAACRQRAGGRGGGSGGCARGACRPGGSTEVRSGSGVRPGASAACAVAYFFHDPITMFPSFLDSLKARDPSGSGMLGIRGARSCCRSMGPDPERRTLWSTGPPRACPAAAALGVYAGGAHLHRAAATSTRRSRPRARFVIGLGGLHVMAVDGRSPFATLSTAGSR